MKPDWHGYALPGGHVEKDESFLDAVKLEMKEETGLEIRNPRLVGLKQFPIDNGRYLVVLFKATEWSGEPTSSEEGKMEWVEYARLPELDTVADLEEMLRMMNSPDLTELRYVPNGDNWIAVIQ